MRLRTVRAAALASAFLAPCSTSSAQQPVTLDDILQHLQANLNAFDKTVPSFFCDEHVLSTMASDNGDLKSVTDSTFRMTRVTGPGHTTTFEESRDIKTIDGGPATSRSQNLEGPSILNGAFESGLAVVSLEQSGCMRYTLQKPNRNRPTEPYVVRFSTTLTGQNTDACLLQEKSTGRILIDPASLHLTRVEITTPHHTIIPAHAYTSPVIGKRTLSIDYAPIQLDAETVWMPSTITMRAVSGDGTFHKITWTFTGTYTNYHKLKVTSHILPNTPSGIP